MTTVPRYESSGRYPSARTAGFLVTGQDDIVGAGMSREQLLALLSRQAPGHESEISVSEVDPRSVERRGWRSITGDELSAEQLDRAMSLGLYRATGPRVSLLAERAIDIYSQLRVGTMAMVLIDWE